MYIPDFSKSSLILLHSAVRQALVTDDNLPEGEKMYGVREWPDWKEWSDGIEAKLDEKGVNYSKIDWGTM
jgi:hypothetical protein